MRLNYSALSDVGRVRRDNQDSGYAGPWLLTVCDGVGVALSETTPGSIVQAAAWRGGQPALLAAIAAVTGLDLPDLPGSGALGETVAAFSIGPGRVLAVDHAEGLAARLGAQLSAATGTILVLPPMPPFSLTRSMAICAPTDEATEPPAANGPVRS